MNSKEEIKTYFELKLVNQRAWFTSTRVLGHYLKQRKKVGEARLEKQRIFQRVREMKAVALFLLGTMKALDYKHELWLQPVTDEPTPDIRTCALGKKGDIPWQFIHEVEVVTFEGHGGCDIVDFIWTKKFANRKSYPKSFVVLCEIRRDIQIPPLTEIHERFRGLRPQGEIAILGRIDPVKELYRAAHVYPLDLLSDFDAVLECQKQIERLKKQGRSHTMLLELKRGTKEFEFKRIKGEAPGPFDDILLRES